MAQIKITVDMGNSAFVDNEDELKEVLIKVAEKAQTQNSGSVNDSNGNKVVSFVIEE
jgi:hypothetical protein